MLARCAALLCVVLSSTAAVVNGADLRVSPDKHHLLKDGNPFSYLCDTGWFAFSMLNREEADKYLKNRADKGFNVIMALLTGGGYAKGEKNAYGEQPLLDNDPLRPNEKFFRHVDYIVNKANSLGMFVAIVPSWSNWLYKRVGPGPHPFNVENDWMLVLDDAAQEYPRPSMHAAKDGERPRTKVNPAALKSWQDSRFGMFVHWGPVSLTGHEIGWSRGAPTQAAEYDNLYKKFNPTKFSADRWVAAAKAAGMKYIMLTTKHHDGFCLWDTNYTDYNIMHSPFHRDVVKELAEACRKQGLRFGMYHSICDWRHPDYPRGSPGGRTAKPSPNMERYVAYLKGQLKELLTSYGPVSVLWFDGEWEDAWTHQRGNDLYDYVHSLQPDIIINNRVGKNRQGMSGVSKGREIIGDYDTPEQTIGAFNMDRPWETCMTICNQWSWKPNDAMKSLPQCLHTLIRTAGGDGNLLFNVGPMPSGEIEPRQVERLKEMGAWLAKYGQSIYGTRGGPYMPAKHVASTRKGNSVYLHILAWPNVVLKLPALPARIVKSIVLTGGHATVEQTASGVEVSVAAADRQPIDTVVALELDAPAISIRPIAVADVGQ